MPLAYLITFATYGAWLHGDERGSVDKQHNFVGEPFLSVEPLIENHMRSTMSQEVYLLYDSRRIIVLETLREVCRYRGWRLIACHIRTNHVHLIVHAEAPPEKVMSDCKAYCSRRLKERLAEPADRKRWTQHGSTRYLWKEDQVAAALDYVINGQGEPMNTYDFRTDSSETDA